MANAFISEIAPNKVRVSSAGVALFNATWPCSPLRSTRAYWFEFDIFGDLVDCDVPESDDGTAAAAMVSDCQAFLLGDVPAWCDHA